jgi:Fe-S-cluster-containing hydrogenase component 2
MPAIKIAEACELDGLCAAICPTGALRRNESDDAISLQFDATGCITCGLCQSVCKNKALSLWPEGDGTVRNSVATLVKRRAVTCVSCGDNFVSAGDEQSCPYCRKTLTLMHELSSLRFGPPHLRECDSNDAAKS